MDYWFQKFQNLFITNELWMKWLILLAVAFVFTVSIRLLLNFISSRLRKITERTISIWDDVGVDIIDRLKAGIIFIWIYYFITKSLNPPEFAQNILLFMVVIVSVLQISIWGQYIIRTWRKNILDKRITADPSSAAALGLLYTAVQITFFAIIILIGLSNLGVDITALLAGLGVGGIAVALAAQNILGDLLASLSIVLDKPFVVGDFIVAGNEKGTVEHIGIKTTRLRSLSGEELILSNKDLLESRVQNFKRMWKRRVVQQFGVTYSTSAEVIEQIPGWVKDFVTSHEKLEFDRCHFIRYGSSSLDFEFVFFVNDSDYNLFMDLQQKLLLDIFRKFSKDGVEFAFPTQSIIIEKLPSPS